MESGFDSIKYHIKKISNEEVNVNDNFNKIKFISDDSLRLFCNFNSCH